LAAKAGGKKSALWAGGGHSQKKRQKNALWLLLRAAGFV